MRLRYIALFGFLPLGLAATIVERITVDHQGRVALFCSELPIGWGSELSPDKQRIIVTLPGAEPSAELRPRSWSQGPIREVYPQRSRNGVKVYITVASPCGYSAVWLPYSRCLLITPLRWEKLSPGDELYHSALLALELGSETVAESLLTEAAHRGSADAAALLATRALSSGRAVTALAWLRQAWRQSTLPEVYGVMAYLAELAGRTELQLQASTHFRNLTERSLPPPPSLAADSLAALTEAMLHFPLQDSPHPPPKPDSGSYITHPLSATTSGSNSVPTPPSASGTPGWILLWSPIVFTGIAAVSVGFALRFLLTALRKRSSSRSSAPFPSYVQAALRHYRSADELGAQQHSPAPDNGGTEQQRERIDPAAQGGQPEVSAPPFPVDTPPERAVPIAPAPEVAQLWRERLRHRSEYLRQQLRNYTPATLPETPEARLRLARHLRIPPEGLELHYRLQAASPETLFFRFRTQESQSFVSADGGESHSVAVE